MKTSGKIIFIDPTKDASKKEGQSFLVRTFGIEIVDDVNGTLYRKYFGFQLSGNRCEILDKFNVGDDVSVTYGIRCSYKEDKTKQGTEQNPNNMTIFTNLDAQDVTLIASTSAPAPSPAAAAATDDLPF